MNIAGHALHGISIFAGPARSAAPISLLSTILPFRVRPSSVADPLDPGPAGFAHRGLHGSSPENSFGSFVAALNIGAGIECDLGLTTDDRAVIFHDRDAMRICASSLVIASSSWAELSRLQVGEHRLPTLETLFALVNGRVPLLLDVKVRNNRLRWATALAGVLSQYPGPFGVMSFDPLLPRLLRAKVPDVRCGLVLKGGLPAWKRQWKMLLANPDFIAVEHTDLESEWVNAVRQQMPVYAWTIRTAGERARAKAHADALIWSDGGRPHI